MKREMYMRWQDTILDGPIPAWAPDGDGEASFADQYVTFLFETEIEAKQDALECWKDKIEHVESELGNGVNVDLPDFDEWIEKVTLDTETGTITTATNSFTTQQIYAFFGMECPN